MAQKKAVNAVTDVVDAVRKNEGAIVKKCLAESTDEIRGLVHLAVACGSMDALTVLLESGYSAIALNDELKVPILIAVEKRFFNSIPILIKNGASFDQITERGQNMLHVAAKNNIIDMVEYFMKSRRSLIDEKDDYGETPLLLSVKNKNIKAVSILVENGANVNIKNNKNDTPFSLAIKDNSISIIEVLLKGGADPNYLIEGKSTALHITTTADSTEVVRLLIKWKADIEAENQFKERPLHVATGQSLKLLLLAGANVNVTVTSETNNNTGTSLTTNLDFTPLGYAINRGNIKDVETILDHSKGGIKDLITPLTIASRKGMLSVIKKLIALGANVQGKENFNPLNVAVMNGNAEVVKILLEHGATIDYQSAFKSLFKNKSIIMDMLLKNKQ